MKLQTKLTLLFAGLLVLVAAALLLALRLVSGIAEENTAKSTLENAVNSFMDKIEYEDGRLKDARARTYDDGAYLQVYSVDGGELLAGTDVFSVGALMPDLLRDHDAGQVFRVDTEEAGVYCYILWKEEDTDGRGRSGKGGASEGAEDSRSAGSDGTGSEGVWIVGILPEDSMENVMASVEKLAWIGLPVIVLLAALGGWAAAGRSLRPLRRITESARSISDGNDLSRRIVLEPGGDEVHELADTFNGMMSRLERSFEAERQFTSDASHELRTPTAVILAECEMAEKTPEDAEAVRESVAEIHKQARKMSELIGKLLSYTRLEQGTRRIDREELDLSELTEEVCEEQNAAAGRGISVESETEPGVTVSGDAALLISLVQNLVSNAVKYGRDGGHVYVRVYKEGQRACVSVRDDGIGISEEDLERIWNRFYQADRARSDENRGVGLGLSLAQQIARLHGGTITAASTLGEGSEFVFSMPASE